MTENIIDQQRAIKVRRANTWLIVMLILSGILSLYISVRLAYLLEIQPHSPMTNFFTMVGRLPGRHTSLYPLSDNEALQKGAFGLPFMIFLGLTFFIYFKMLGIKIDDRAAEEKDYPDS